MPIRLIYDPSSRGFHHHRVPQRNDLFKQVTKSFNYWIHKFNWKKDSKALMVGAAALAGLVVATGLMTAGIASLFSKKEGQVKQQNPKDQSFKMDVPKQVTGENGVERHKVKVDLKINKENLQAFSDKLSFWIERLGSGPFKLENSDENNKLIFLNSTDTAYEDYIKLDSLTQEVKKSRTFINKEREKVTHAIDRDEAMTETITGQYRDELTTCSAKLEKLEELIKQIKKQE